MLEVASPEYKTYARQVQLNCAALAKSLMTKGHKMMSGGTDNHLLLWDLRPHALTGSKFEKLLEYCSISVNKNTVAGDKSALSPNGIRVGTAALTTRGMKEADMEKVAVFFDRAIVIAKSIQEKNCKALKDFIAAIPTSAEAQALRQDVENFAITFPMPGFDVATLKYKDGLPHH